MVSAESRISRRSPDCFSSSIDRDRVREDRGAANRIAAAFDGAPAHQIDPAAKALFEILLESSHFEEPNLAPG